MVRQDVNDKNISAVAERVIRRHQKALDMLGDVVRGPLTTYVRCGILYIRPRYESDDTTADWVRNEER